MPQKTPASIQGLQISNFSVVGVCPSSQTLLIFAVVTAQRLASGAGPRQGAAQAQGGVDKPRPRHNDHAVDVASFAGRCQPSSGPTQHQPPQAAISARVARAAWTSKARRELVYCRGLLPMPAAAQQPISSKYRPPQGAVQALCRRLAAGLKITMGLGLCPAAAPGSVTFAEILDRRLSHAR